MVDFLIDLNDRGLLDTGEYVVIHVDFDTFDNVDSLKYFKSKYLLILNRNRCYETLVS